jgi:hypothetical protein
MNIFNPSYKTPLPPVNLPSNLRSEVEVSKWLKSIEYDNSADTVTTKIINMQERLHDILRFLIEGIDFANIKLSPELAFVNSVIKEKGILGSLLLLDWMIREPKTYFEASAKGFEIK